jgi:hypothetical protein
MYIYIFNHTDHIVGKDQSDLLLSNPYARNNYDTKRRMNEKKEVKRKINGNELEMTREDRSEGRSVEKERNSKGEGNNDKRI